MKINGQQVFNGTLVVAPGEQAEIQLPGGLLPIDFRTDTGPGRIDFVGGTMVFFNMDNAVGSAATPTITVPGHAPFALRVVMYAIGTGANAYHLLHYTVG